jgi:predicted CopG family antitoxin
MSKIIKISDEVWDVLRDMGKTGDSFDDVLRKVLNVEPRNKKGQDLTCRGGRIPHGIKVIAAHKGERYEAEIKNGAFWYNDKPYKGPSPAAMSITHSSVNGWSFWGIVDKEEKWKPLLYYRKLGFAKQKI